MNKKNVMSGMRPTGQLHLGHYIGVLTNWVRLQDEYNCFYSIVDWHALTTSYENTSSIKNNVLEVALDWIACGLDPEKSTLYVQSKVPEIAQIFLILSMITPFNWVERDPALKDLVKMVKSKEESQSIIENSTYGMIGYPVLQTADIIAMHGDYVPIGQDQLAHLELSRDIVRRFNKTFKVTYFKEPKPLLTQTPLLKGIDGQKMGKSFDNDIKIADSKEVSEKKIMQGVTDTNRILRSDPGNPDNCQVIFPYYKAFTTEDVINQTRKECENAERGCGDCKKILSTHINTKLEPIREKREHLKKNPRFIYDILEAGEKKARETARQTLSDMTNIMEL